MTIAPDIFESLPPRSYRDIRHEVRDGDVLLCSADDPQSKLIRWATRSQWSHVALAFWMRDIERVIVLECVERLGVRAVPLSSFVQRTSNGVQPYPGRILLARHEGFADPARQQPLKRIAEFAFDRLGDKFSSGEMAKIALRIALGRFGIRTPPLLAPADEFICSEYVARCFETVGIRVPWRGQGFMAPSDIAADPALKPVAQVDTRNVQSGDWAAPEGGNLNT